MEDGLGRELEELKQLIKELGAKIARAIERARELEARLRQGDPPESTEDPPVQRSLRLPA